MNNVTDCWKKIKIQSKYGFFSTLIFGLISHGMGLFNKFSMDDDLHYFFFHNENPLWAGRWAQYFLVRAEKIFFGDGNYSLPIINGGFTIVCIGIAVCLLIDLLDIKSEILCISLGGLFVSIPSVTHMFGDMYVSHFFSLSLLLSVLGPYLILKKEKWFYAAFGIILMVLSTAIYQAYIPVMISTFLFTLIKLFYDSNTKNQRVILYKKTAVILLSCFLLIFVYILSTRIINKCLNVTLTDYKNISEMGKLPVSVYIERIIIAYREFFLPSRNRIFDFYPGTIRTINFILTFLLFFLFIVLLWSEKKKYVKNLILLFLVVLIPFTVNFIFVMADYYSCYMMMVYSKVMFFLIFAWVLEKTMGNIQSVFVRCFKGLCIGGLVMLVVMYSRYDNICYLQMELLQTQATRYFTTLITRIQSAEGYNSWQYVSYIGDPDPGRNDNSIETIPEMDNVMFFPYWGLKNTLQGPWREYMKMWCGYSAHEVDQSYIIDRPEVQAMPHYPAEGSIKVIDDTVVVKF